MEVVTIHLIFWRDGLTAGDGPLRPYSDPATMRFLELIDNEYRQCVWVSIYRFYI